MAKKQSSDENKKEPSVSKDEYIWYVLIPFLFGATTFLLAMYLYLGA